MNEKPEHDIQVRWAGDRIVAVRVRAENREKAWEVYDSVCPELFTHEVWREGFMRRASPLMYNDGPGWWIRKVQ